MTTVLETGEKAKPLNVTTLFDGMEFMTLEERTTNALADSQDINPWRSRLVSADSSRHNIPGKIIDGLDRWLNFQNGLLYVQPQKYSMDSVVDFLNHTFNHNTGFLIHMGEDIPPIQSMPIVCDLDGNDVKPLKPNAREANAGLIVPKSQIFYALSSNPNNKFTPRNLQLAAQIGLRFLGHPIDMQNPKISMERGAFSIGMES